MGTNKKLKKLFIFIIVIFILSFIISLIQGDLSHMTSYDFGKMTGEIMKKLLIISGKLGLLLFVIRKIKDNKRLIIR
jgi:hypothetical protein